VLLTCAPSADKLCHWAISKSDSATSVRDAEPRDFFIGASSDVPNLTNRMKVTGGGPESGAVWVRAHIAQCIRSVA